MSFSRAYRTDCLIIYFFSWRELRVKRETYSCYLCKSIPENKNKLVSVTDSTDFYFHKKGKKK